MISIKKLLSSDGNEFRSNNRITWLILEAVAVHAVAADPAEHAAFQSTVREIGSRMEKCSTGEAALLLTGEAIKSIGTYNREVQQAMTAQIKELQSIVALFTRSLLQMSNGNASAACNLRQIERQIESCSQSDDLRALKAQLATSLEVICAEAAQQERSSERISAQLKEVMGRPGSSKALADAVSDIDLATGLQNFDAANVALTEAVNHDSDSYAALFCVERVALVTARFGEAVADRIMMLFTQHLTQRLSAKDRLFRWHGPFVLALLDRSGAEMHVRTEISRIAAVRLEPQIELSGRSVLLPIVSSWMLTSVANVTMDNILQKFDTFCSAHLPGLPNVNAKRSSE